MTFIELENIMESKGATTLAEIARYLNTTPQAVSNWKARDQVPHRIVALINKPVTNISSSPVQNAFISQSVEEHSISFSDILVTLAEQLKIIFLTGFLFVFFAFTYVQYILHPEYISKATILLPSYSQNSNLSGLSGLASQFGVNVPTGSPQADLSSPTFFPELLRSRTFAEKILDKEFYTKRYGKKLSLLAILTYGDEAPNAGKDTLITYALSDLQNILSISKASKNSKFSIIEVVAFEAHLAKELAEVAVSELEKLNRYYKSQNVNEKTIFISNRIAAVKNDLESSEKSLKEFNERNRQISSPSLELELGRLSTNVEVQKGIYLTLKQQYELAKIEEVQKASIVQVLDEPQVPLRPSNKNLKVTILLSGIFGIAIGTILGFFRSFLDNNDIKERKKIRRFKHFLKKKTKDIILDNRVSGIVSVVMILGFPFYFGYESENPVYFGLYSKKIMILNSIYFFVLITFIILYIVGYIQKRDSK